MSVMKVMEILNEFEAKASADIARDHAIDADAFESVGKHILIRKIKSRIQKEIDVNDKEAA